MKVTIDNQKKLKGFVPGECVFPFKYRKKEVVTCQRKKEGKWCATSTDEEGKMKTWGWCKEEKTKTKKCPPGKILNIKTGRCIIDKSKSVKPLKRTLKLPKVKRNDLLEEIQQLSKSTNCDLFTNNHSDLKFLGKGVANRVYLSCFNEECKRRVAVRLMSVDNNLPYDKTHPNKLEISAYTKFNSLLSKNITQHIPYKIKSFKCSISELESTPINEAISNYRTLYSYGDIKQDIDILITEYCKHGSAKSFLTDNLTDMTDLDLKIFIFQFMTGLATLQYHIPGFKHNDIHSENVLVGTYNLKDQTRENNKYVKYILFSKEFYVPFREYCVKIYDFDTMSSNLIINEKLNDDIYKEVGVTREHNPIFDYHLGMNSMFKISDFLPKHSQTRDFFNRQIPMRLRGNDNRFLYYARLTNYYQTYNLDKTNLIPNDMDSPSYGLIHDKFFDEFRVKPEGAEIVDTINSKIPPFEEIKDLNWMFK